MSKKCETFMELILLKINNLRTEAILEDLALDQFVTNLREFSKEISDEIDLLYTEGHQLFKNFD